MDPFQSALHDQADTLASRATRLLLELAFGGVRAVLREVRGLQKRVRLWLIAIALCLPALPPAVPRGKSGHTSTGRKSQTKRRPPERLGLRLGTGARDQKTRQPPSAKRDSNCPARSKEDREADRFVTLAELVFQLHDLQRTIADPSTALKRLARTLRRATPAAADTAPPSQTDDTDPYPDVPQAGPSRTDAARRSDLPRPDT